MIVSSSPPITFDQLYDMAVESDPQLAKAYVDQLTPE